MIFFVSEQIQQLNTFVRLSLVFVWCVWFIRSADILLSGAENLRMSSV